MKKATPTNAAAASRRRESVATNPPTTPTKKHSQTTPEQQQQQQQAARRRSSNVLIEDPLSKRGAEDKGEVEEAPPPPCLTIEDMLKRRAEQRAALTTKFNLTIDSIALRGHDADDITLIEHARQRVTEALTTEQQQHRYLERRAEERAERLKLLAAQQQQTASSSVSLEGTASSQAVAAADDLAATIAVEEEVDEEGEQLMKMPTLMDVTLRHFIVGVGPEPAPVVKEVEDTEHDEEFALTKRRGVSKTKVDVMNKLAKAKKTADARRRLQEQHEALERQKEEERRKQEEEKNKPLQPLRLCDRDLRLSSAMRSFEEHNYIVSACLKHIGERIRRHLLERQIEEKEEMANAGCGGNGRFSEPIQGIRSLLYFPSSYDAVRPRMAEVRKRKVESAVRRTLASLALSPVCLAYVCGRRYGSLFHGAVREFPTIFECEVLISVADLRKNLSALSFGILGEAQLKKILTFLCGKPSFVTPGGASASASPCVTPGMSPAGRGPSDFPSTPQVLLDGEHKVKTIDVRRRFEQLLRMNLNQSLLLLYSQFLTAAAKSAASWDDNTMLGALFVPPDITDEVLRERLVELRFVPPTATPRGEGGDPSQQQQQRRNTPLAIFLDYYRKKYHPVVKHVIDPTANPLSASATADVVSSPLGAPLGGGGGSSEAASFEGARGAFPPALLQVAAADANPPFPRPERQELYDKLKGLPDEENPLLEGVKVWRNSSPQFCTVPTAEVRAKVAQQRAAAAAAAAASLAAERKGSTGSPTNSSASPSKRKSVQQQQQEKDEQIPFPDTLYFDVFCQLLALSPYFALDVMGVLLDQFTEFVPRHKGVPAPSTSM